MTDHLPKRERLALKAELQMLHRQGRSDYQLAQAFGVSPGAVNRARLHALIGRKVATAIYAALQATPENLMLRHPLPATPGCHACEMRRAPRENGLAIVSLCPMHALEVAKALLG